MHRSRVRSYVIQVLIMHTTGIEDTGKNLEVSKVSKKIFFAEIIFESKKNFFAEIDENVHNSVES